MDSGSIQVKPDCSISRAIYTIRLRLIVKCYFDFHALAIVVHTSRFLPKKVKQSWCQTIKLQLYYFFLTFLNNCLSKCLHLLRSTDFSFNIFSSLIKLIIHSFSVKHNLQKSGLGLLCTFVIILHLTEKLISLRFSCQIYFVNSALFSYF